MTMNVAIYARVSTIKQVEEGYSISTQLELCRNKAKALGALFIDEYVDDGYSGEFLERPDLQRFIENVKSGKNKYSALIVYKLDRLSRDNVGLISIVKILHKYNIKLILPEGTQYSSTAQDLFMLQVLGAVAQFDNAQRRERSLSGKIAKRKQGKLDKNYKYGYTYNEQTQNFDINENEAKYVRLIFDWYANEGLGSSTICKRLNLMNVPRNFYNKETIWSSIMIFKIITDEGYAGILSTMKYKYEKIGQNKTRKIKRDVSEWIKVPIPAIVEHELWEKANQIYRQKSFKKKMISKHSWLLQGLIYCGYCKSPMYIYSTYSGKKSSKTKDKVLYYYYKCRTNIRKTFGGNKVCENRNISIPYLEDLVWNILSDNFSNKTKLKTFVKKNNNLSSANNDVNLFEIANKKYNKALTKKEKILSWFVNGTISEEAADIQLTKINSELKKLSKQIADLKNKSTHNFNNLSVDELFDRFNSVKNPDRETKREIILAIVNKVYVKRVDDTRGMYSEPKLEINIVLN